MSVKYINRKGKTYYLHQQKSKTGNTKYVFSLKEDGELVYSIPTGYEIYENPNAQVFLRKVSPKIITDEEISIVENGVKSLTQLPYFKIDIKKNKIIILLPNQDVDGLKELFSKYATRDDIRIPQLFEKILSYSPMMRFTLVDKQAREFTVERMCFLSDTDEWLFLDSSKTLQKLVKKYCPHLDKESFYELI